MNQDFNAYKGWGLKKEKKIVSLFWLEPVLAKKVLDLLTVCGIGKLLRTRMIPN